ncbi:MAG: HD domain-containing protein [Candidatus Dormibacteraceae bacterium]
MTSLEEWAQGRLRRQLSFLLDAHRLTAVERRSRVAGGERRETTAEHSWHLALLCLVLGEHAPEGVDLNRVLRMLVVHDVVEVDAGDTYVYDRAGQAGKLDRERVAARRIYGALPDDQGTGLRVLWEEFEARESPDARFAAALDRLAPFLLNLDHRGGSWREFGVSAEQVREITAQIGEGAPELGPFVEAAIEGAVAAGWLGAGPTRRW